MDKEKSKLEILKLAEVHPIRRSLLAHILNEHNLDWSDIDEMVKRGLLKEICEGGEIFYIVKSR